MTDPTKPGDPADKAADAKADGNFGGVTSHRSGYSSYITIDGVEYTKLEWIERTARRGGTLASGEGALLVEEIDRLRAEKMALRKELESLRAEVRDKQTDWEMEHAETVRLRAAIERVRALHQPYTNIDGVARCWNDGLHHPCPTLRALDGEDA